MPKEKSKISNTQFDTGQPNYSCHNFILDEQWFNARTMEGWYKLSVSFITIWTLPIISQWQQMNSCNYIILVALQYTSSKNQMSLS